MMYVRIFLGGERMSNKVIINTDVKKGTINKNIYGHFAEHLGRCIYEGFWVGEDSNIENTNGIRNDVVEALKKINIPVLRWLVVALLMNTIGKMVLVHVKIVNAWSTRIGVV